MYTVAEKEKEYARQITHISFGLIIVAMLYLFNRAVVELALIAIITFQLLLVNYKNLGWKNKLIDWIFEKLERKVMLQGKGSLMILSGILFAVAFAPSERVAMGLIAILALGDGLSTLVGIHGKYKLHWNKKKSLEGTLTFALAALAVGFLFFNNPWFFAFSLALIESFDLTVDDNLLIPVLGVILAYFPI